VPFLVRLAILRHYQVAILIDRQLRLPFIQLHKSVMGVAEDTNGIPLHIADMLE